MNLYPPGYSTQPDSDTLTLIGPDGETVTSFGESFSEAAVIDAAWEAFLESEDSESAGAHGGFPTPHRVLERALEASVLSEEERERLRADHAYAILELVLEVMEGE